MSTHEEWTIAQDGKGCWSADRGDEEYGVTVTVDADKTIDVDVDGALAIKAMPASVLVELLRAAGALP